MRPAGFGAKKSIKGGWGFRTFSNKAKQLFCGCIQDSDTVNTIPDHSAFSGKPLEQQRR